MPDSEPPAMGPELAELRKKIDSLNLKMMAALKTAQAPLREGAGRMVLEQRMNSVLQGKGITQEVRQAACAPLLQQDSK
jgi:hypothetical protein